MLAVEQEVSYKYIKVGQGSLQRFNPNPFVFGEKATHIHIVCSTSSWACRKETGQNGLF